MNDMMNENGIDKDDMRDILAQFMGWKSDELPYGNYLIPDGKPVCDTDGFEILRRYWAPDQNPTHFNMLYDKVRQQGWTVRIHITPYGSYALCWRYEDDETLISSYSFATKVLEAAAEAIAKAIIKKRELGITS